MMRLTVNFLEIHFCFCSGGGWYRVPYTPCPHHLNPNFVCCQQIAAPVSQSNLMLTKCTCLYVPLHLFSVHLVQIYNLSMFDIWPKI